MHAIITDPKDQLSYAFGGHAVFTLVSLKTGRRYTYKIERGTRNPEVFLVSILTDGDTYVWLGYVKPHHTWHCRADTPAWGAFLWWLRAAKAGRTERVEIWHSGVCSRCKRTLTTPESISRGLGPVCAEKVTW
jgi:hypothetical protein